MATYSWTTGVSGDWNTGTLWSPATVPNDAAADVTIDAAAPANASYTVTIGAGETETINSLSMNGATNLAGANNPLGYFAAELEIDGTLAFAPGSTGLLDGSLQTFVHIGQGATAEIINGGTLNGFIQDEGNLLLTGTNGIYITNDLQVLGSGTATIDSPIAELIGNTLTDGILRRRAWAQWST